MTAFEHIYDVENERFVHYRAERAGVNARAAGDALVVVDASLFFVAHLYGFNFASRFARAFVVKNRAVRADFRACAAFFAFCFVDMRHVIFVEGDRAESADVLATVRKATAAGVSDFVTAHRTFVAGDIDNFYDVRVLFVAAHREFHAFR